MKIREQEMTKIKRIKRDMVKIAKRCSSRNAQTGNGGNISVKLDDEHMIIMASKSSFADCKEGNFVTTNLNCELVSGKKAPSRESLLHAAIYRKFKHVNAIVHCHSPFATSWAATMLPLPFSTYHAETKLKSNLKVFDTGGYAVPEDKVAEIMDQYELNEEIKGFLLKKHGAFAFGENILEASYIADLIEETAQIRIIGELLAK